MGRISCVLEEVSAFVRCDEIADGSDGLPEGVEGGRFEELVFMGGRTLWRRLTRLGHLRGRDRDDAVSRRRPQKAALLQPPHVKARRLTVCQITFNRSPRRPRKQKMCPPNGYVARHITVLMHRARLCGGAVLTPVRAGQSRLASAT